MLSPSEAWPVVQEAILVFRANVPDMAKARHALAQVLKTGAWRSYDSPTGAKCSYDDFTAWVRAPVPLGLHTTVPNLREIARGDEVLTDALEAALGSRQGARTDLTDGYTGDVDSNFVPNRDEVTERPRGDTVRRALRKLRTEAEGGNRKAAELHADVLDGRISAHAAMVTAGYRPRTFTVRADDPAHAARTLRTYYGKNREQLALLIKYLKEEQEN